MVARTILITAPDGLHARPAKELVALAKSFQSKILLRTDVKEVDAKSIIGILSLGLKNGTEVKVITDGADQDQALDKVCELLENLRD